MHLTLCSSSQLLSPTDAAQQLNEADRLPRCRSAVWAWRSIFLVVYTCPSRWRLISDVGRRGSSAILFWEDSTVPPARGPMLTVGGKYRPLAFNQHLACGDYAAAAASGCVNRVLKGRHGANCGPPNQRMQPTAYRAVRQVVWRLRRSSGWSTLAVSCVRPAV